MTREEAIEKVRQWSLPKETMEVLKVLAPELKESDDEKIRKRIKLCLAECVHKDIIRDYEHDEAIAWLEKQKEQKPSINIKQLKSLMLQYFQEAANEKDDSDIEADTDKWARKILGYDFEQKPADEQFPPLEGLDAIKAKYYDDGFKNGFDEGVESVKPAEWSEEDGKEFNDTLYDGFNAFEDGFNKGYELGKHDLAMEFLNYLDKNCPEGKMCVSNGECEDIDKAFKENDWAKIIRYAKKYQILQEQKPEVKHIGWVARDSEHNPYFGLGLVLFRGKPRRTGDCWSGEIASHLPWNLFPDLKWEDEPVKVEVTIRRKINRKN